MKTVLLIEDNCEILENTCELLELNGFRVIPAFNGKIGILLASEIKPDIILCDIMMPEMNGYEVFTRLKKNEKTTSIPFVFLTASVERKDVELAFGMGVQGYIRKPFDIDELIGTINKCLKVTASVLH